MISDLLGKVQAQSDIGAGDIANIVDVLDRAMGVQKNRIAQAGEGKSDYAQNYTVYRWVVSRSQSKNCYNFVYAFQSTAPSWLMTFYLGHKRGWEFQKTKRIKS